MMLWKEVLAIKDSELSSENPAWNHLVLLAVATNSELMHYKFGFESEDSVYVWCSWTLFSISPVRDDIHTKQVEILRACLFSSLNIGFLL